MGIGYNTIDIAECRKHNIAVSNCPASSSEAVAEHAFALYYAAKRRIVDMHLITLKAEDWPVKSSVFGMYPHLPRVARHETMGSDETWSVTLRSLKDPESPLVVLKTTFTQLATTLEGSASATGIKKTAKLLQ
jgi:hypothetical protein